MSVEHKSLAKNSDHSQADDASGVALRRTPLFDLHLSMGAKMVPFAGYELPVSYRLGTLKEHLHVRQHAGLFDVSHMGQFLISSEGDAAELMERLVPGNIKGLKPGRMRYTQLTNDDGGIIDDLMVTRLGSEGGREWLFLVVNGARKDVDYYHMEQALGDKAEVQELSGQALLALQGPSASMALGTIFDNVSEMPFMSTVKSENTDFGDVWISRCGYTGEDGFELSCRSSNAYSLAESLVEADEVEACGLGARDSLRLEAGLCLYGHDIDEITSPVEAGLEWSISKRRREHGGFPGAEQIFTQLASGAPRRLVGISPLGRTPVREGAVITDSNENFIGKVTSGGFSPSLGRPVAIGYVDHGFEEEGTSLGLLVRGKVLPAVVAAMPFVPHRYYKP